MCFFGTRNRLASHAGLGTIGANNGARANAFSAPLTGHPSIADSIMNPADTVGITLEFLEDADAPNRSGIGGPDPQPLVKMFAVDHADEAAFNRHINVDCGRGNHPCRFCTCDQQLIWNQVVLDEPGRNRPATGLDPTRAIKQQNRASFAGEFLSGRGAGRPTTHDHDVKSLCLVPVDRFR